MILNATYKNKDTEELVNDLVGLPFSLRKRIRMHGVGSKRMIIENLSPKFPEILASTSDLKFANIELRPNGIIVHLSNGLTKYIWVLPYFHLSIYKTPNVSLHGQGHSLHFRNNVTYRENKEFFKKLMREKSAFDMQYQFQNTENNLY